MENFKKASLVTGPDGLRCIYEIEGSGQKFDARFPYIKKAVRIAPVKNKDIRDTLELLGVLKDGRTCFKGIKMMADKFSKELSVISGKEDKAKLETLGIILNGKITELGLKQLQIKMMDEMATINGGLLAINESSDNESLLKVIL